MPTNVTVEYAIAEREYQEATTTKEKITALEHMLSTCPTHKGAEKLRQEIKTRLAKLRAAQKKEAEKRKKGSAISVKREGAAQVVIVGTPGSGKSMLLSKITNAKPVVCEYGFTTKKPEVGMLDYKGAKIQCIEIPAIVKGFAEKEHGGEFLSIIRGADLVLIVTDSDDISIILCEFDREGVRLNRKRPAIKIKKTGMGGIEFIGAEMIRVDQKDVKDLLINEGFHNAIVEVGESAGLDDFADAMNEGLVFLPAMIVLTKYDLPGYEQIYEMLESNYTNFEIVPVSLTEDLNIEKLKQRIWEKLNLIRIYTKEVGKKAKLDEPLCLKSGSRIRDMASLIHKDFIKKFRFARIWGKSVKFPGSQAGLEHVLADGDIVEIHLK